MSQIGCIQCHLSFHKCINHTCKRGGMVGRDGVRLGGMVEGWCQTLFLVLTWRDGVWRDGVRLCSWFLRGGMVSDFVLGSYVPSSKPKIKSDTWHSKNKV